MTTAKAIADELSAVIIHTAVALRDEIQTTPPFSPQLAGAMSTVLIAHIARLEARIEQLERRGKRR
ncbi:MAG: hypothetical protein QM777_16920 [Pseudorhodoferax sp.]